jgi:phenylacetate-CoA ligase
MLDGCWLAPLRRNFFEPFFCSFRNVPLRRYWQELENTQFLPEEILREKQWLRLEKLVRFTWENNAFYRARFENAGITPDMIKAPEDLRLIPIISKEEIRQNISGMISSGFTREGLMHAKTGGSTGKSLDIYFTEECSEMRNACARRHDRWSGWEVGEPVAAIWGNPHLPTGFKEKIRNWLLAPFIYLDTMNVTEESVRQFAREWKRISPTLLFGHAHSIFVLAQYIRKMKIDNVRPRGIISSSMMLLPHERKVIEEVFGVIVTDRYGCEEVSLIGSECEKHEGMHLNIEHLFIEFIRDDGSAAGPGEPGHIVVTDLMNYAMPFIRYKIEDVGVSTDRKCSCGRGLPLMENITGRVADFLIGKDGSRVAGVSLIENTLTKFPGIDQMQIVQEALELIRLVIVPGKDYSENVALQLVNYFKMIFGEHIEVRIEMTENIRPEPSGKYRFSICKI